MQHRSNVSLALILAPFVFSFAFAMDIFVPVVPEMRAMLHTSQFMVQLTLSLFLLAISVGEIFLGPIADQFGRVRIILISTVFYILGAILSALAPSVSVLIGARIVCAFGACGLLVVSFAIVRDLRTGDSSAQMYSWLNAAIGISPTFAPIIGGYLATFFGWRAVFWFLALLGVVVCINILFFVRETLPVERRKKINHEVFQRYLTILKNKVFLAHTLYAAVGVSVCFSFFSISSVIIIEILKVKQEIFGYYFASFGLVLIIGGILAGNIAYKRGHRKTIMYGIILMLLGGTSMIITNLLWGLHLWLFLPTMVIACLGAVFCIGSGAAGAMEPFPDFAGTAAAAFQAGEFLFASIVGTILMHFPVHSSLPFAVCVLVVATIALLTYIMSKSQTRH